MKKDILLALSALLLACISCTSNEEAEEPFVRLKNTDGSALQTNIVIDADKASKSLLISSNGSWKLQPSESWLAVSPAQGAGDGSVRLDFSQNESLLVRSAQIAVLLNDAIVLSIHVEQYGAAARLAVLPDTQGDLSAEGATLSFSVDANAAWTYTNSAPEWLTETSRTDKALTFSAAENLSPTPRSATLKFSLADYSNYVEFTVTQKTGIVADMLDIVFHNDGTAEDVSQMHNTVTTLESTALFTSYNSALERYCAVFKHTAGAGVTAGYYKIDYANNQAFKDKLADGHTLELLASFDDDMPKNMEIKPFSSMEAGGTGLMISSDNQLTYLPNISTTGTSNWLWTRSGVTPEKGKIYHLVGVWNKQQQKTAVYINGELKNRVDAPGNLVFPNAVDKYWFGIGADAGASGQAAWRGKVFLARVYDDPLTDSEVTSLWNRVNRQQPASTISLENISFLSPLQVVKGGGFTILATGFAAGDKVRLTSLTDANITSLCDGVASASNMRITLPSNLASGRYRLSVVRGAETLDIGFVTFDVVDTLPTVQPRVIAHRGYWNTAGSAENSLASLIKAQELEVYGSEFDVWMTTDGVCVLNHDPTVNGIRIDAVTYEQLKDIKLSNGEKLPLLEDYLEQGKKAPSCKLILEIKTHSTTDKNNAVAAAVVSKVQAAGMTAQVEYIAFDYNICRKLLELQPGATVAYLNGDRTPQSLKDVGIMGIDYTYSILFANTAWVTLSHQLGMTVNIWTVNAEADLIKAINLGVDYITTDNPVLAKQLINLLR